MLPDDNVTAITELVDLCRKYTREEWEKASFRAASQWVDEVCAIMARHTEQAA